MNSAVFRQWDLGVSALSLAINRNGDWIAIALGDGDMCVLPADASAETPKIIAVHDGISLSLRPDADPHAFLSGGDDGKVVIIDPILGQTTLLVEHKNQWIDHVASSVDERFRVYNAGKKIHVLNEEGLPHFVLPIETASNPGDLAFSPNSKRLAVSHYNGASVWWMNAKDSQPTILTWKGSHLDLLWSPDGKVLMTSMQENALHGWQLSDTKEMRMQGYAKRIHSMGFTARGKYLATAGADQVICWPFSGGGPWDKEPLTLGSADKRLVTRVAAHPKDELAAAGYDDGMIVMAPLDGRMEIMVHAPTNGPQTAINGLVWNSTGDALFATTESGTVLLFTIESVRNALVKTGRTDPR